MPIPKNAVNFREEAQALARAIDRYHEVCSWALARNSIAATVTAHVKLTEQQNIVNTIMAGRTVADFETALRDVFQLDPAAWDSFRASAISVHATLVPAVLAAIQAAEATLLAQTFGADGVPTPSGSLTQAEANSIRTALQAVVNEYV